MISLLKKEYECGFIHSYAATFKTLLAIIPDLFQCVYIYATHLRVCIYKIINR